MSVAAQNWNLAEYNRVLWSDGRIGVFCMGHVQPQTFLFDVLPYMEGWCVNAPPVKDTDVRHIYLRVGPRSGRVYFCKPDAVSAFSATIWLLAGKYAAPWTWE